MLHSQLTAEQKRKNFKAAINSGKALQFPGAFNAVSAQLIQDHGFDGVYISGAVIAADLGLPDIGLTTASEVIGRAQQIARMTNLPTLADADTGFGEVLNLARTVQLFEDAGISAIHIEDQVNPKRCGHLDGKTVVGDEQAQQRIASAVKARRDPNFQIFARTDIRGVDGLDAAIARAKLLQEAGADAIFAEAMASLNEFSAIRTAVDIPILANMTEFGKSDLFTLTELQKVGVNIVIYPVSLLRVAMGAAERALISLKNQGTLQSEVSGMQTRSRLYELLDYEKYQDFDNSVFNFTLNKDQ
jgi:methylisocitrate lyase